MSLSSLVNTSPVSVSAANLSCNTLNCNSLTVLNPVEYKFPTTSQSLNIADAVGSFTNSLTFSGFPTSGAFTQDVSDLNSPYIVATIPGVYIVNLFIDPVVMGATLNSYGNITMVFKSDNGSGGIYSELAEVTSNINNTVTANNNKYRITQIFSIPVTDTRLQVLFRRQDAAAAAGTIVVPLNSASAISFFKLA